MGKWDVRYALRMMRRSPAFTTVAVLSLALGTGANTAIFTLIDNVMLRRLPVPHPEQLAEPLHWYREEPRFNGYSREAYELFRDHNHVFSGLLGMAGAHSQGGSTFNLRIAGPGMEKADGSYVTGNFFPVLGVKPALGRLIGPPDDRAAAPGSVAVVSWTYWKNRFNLDRGILGRQILVDGLPVAIVGVAERGFNGLRIDSSEDLWLPAALEPAPNRSLAIVGRLKPGVSFDQARAEMQVLVRQAIAEEMKIKGHNPYVAFWEFDLQPAGAGLSSLARQEFGKPLLLLMAVVGLLLLIACANVASLLLARGAARQREMALRVSLGAGRWRLARMVLIESLLLSAAGSLLGVLLAYFATGTLVRILASGRIPITLHVRPDARVLLFTAAVAVLTGLLFGLAPAWRAWGSAPAASLREAGRAGDTRLRRLFGKSLVAAQVALSIMLLSAAGLFLWRLSSLYAGLGFERDHILLVTLDPSGSGFQGPRLAQAYRQLLERLGAIRGVRSATLASLTPISGLGANRPVTVEGYQARPGELRNVLENWIAPRYFETLGTPFLEGRDFAFADQGRPRVAIVNRTMARYFFGDRSPLGKHVLFDGEDQPYEIVGVVADAKYQDVGEAMSRTIYFNAFQHARVPSRFALRTSGPPADVAREVRAAVRDLLKTIPVTRVTTMADQVDASMVPERLMVALSGLFGALGAVLAAIGLYGLLAYTVARRINEIGIRMALGATGADVTRMVLANALGMVLAGLALGVPTALACQRFARGLIEDLPAKVAAPIAAGAVTMIAVALVAAWLPARRAARVDPMEALRYQ